MKRTRRTTADGPRSWLRWVTLIVLGTPALLLALFVAAFVIGSDRLEHELEYWVRVNLPEGFTGCTDLRFGEPGAPPTRAEGAIYVVDLPRDGRWHSDGSVDPGASCFEQPLKWDNGKGPGPLP